MIASRVRGSFPRMREGARLRAEALAKEGGFRGAVLLVLNLSKGSLSKGRKGATVLLRADITKSEDQLCRNAQAIVPAAQNNHSPMPLSRSNKNPQSSNIFIWRSSFNERSPMVRFSLIALRVRGSFPRMREGARGFRGRKGATLVPQAVIEYFRFSTQRT